MDRVEVVILEVAILVMVHHLVVTQVAVIAEEITRGTLRRIIHLIQDLVIALVVLRRQVVLIIVQIIRHIQDLVIVQVVHIHRVVLTTAQITRHIQDRVIVQVVHILRVALAVLMADHLVVLLIRVVALLHRGLATVVEVVLQEVLDIAEEAAVVHLLHLHRDQVTADNIIKRSTQYFAFFMD